MKELMKKHFVTFYSPGTFIVETVEKPIDSWDVGTAVKMSMKISERYNAKPYGFQFTTRARAKDELDSKVIKKSCFYYISGKIETLEEVEARNDLTDSILISNMRVNKWKRVVVTHTPWRWAQQLQDSDIVLDATP